MQPGPHRSATATMPNRKTSETNIDHFQSITTRTARPSHPLPARPVKQVHSTLRDNSSQERAEAPPAPSRDAIKNLDLSHEFSTSNDRHVIRSSAYTNTAAPKPHSHALSYSPGWGITPKYAMTQDTQSSHRQYEARSFSSVPPSSRKLAGRNGVRINQLAENFFSYQDPSSAPSAPKGRTDEAWHSSKLPHGRNGTQRSGESFFSYQEPSSALLAPSWKPDHSFRSINPPEPVPPWPVVRNVLSETSYPLKHSKPFPGAERVPPYLERVEKPRSPPPTIVQKPPQPTLQYIEHAIAEPHRSAIPQRLLVVLDLNGTLVCRNRNSGTAKPRFKLKPFLNYCFNYHEVMIWSSARPSSVNRMCHQIFSKAQLGKLVAVWARDTLELSVADYKEKVQVYKRLDRIWDNQEIQSKHPQYDTGGGWDQSNTLLIDDSSLKASAQPWNHLNIPEYLAGKGSDIREQQTQVLGKVAGFMHDLRKYDDVSRCVHKRAFDNSQSYGNFLRLKAHEERESMGVWANSLTRGVIFED